MRGEVIVSCCHMVAKFLDDNQLKTCIRTVSNSISLIQFHFHQSYSVSFYLMSNVSKILWGWIQTDCTSKFRKRKRKRNFSVVVTHSIKRVCENRKFCVAVIWWWQRNVQKSTMHVQSCFFWGLNLLHLYCSCCRHCCHCLSSPLLWSRNFANMAMWGHTFLLYNYLMVETLDKTCQIDNKNLLKNYWIQ